MNTHELIVHSLLDSDAMLMFCQGCGAEINVGVMPTMDTLLQAAAALTHTGGCPEEVTHTSLGTDLGDFSKLELDELRQGLQLRQSQLAKLRHDLLANDLNVPYDIQELIRERGETSTSLLNRVHAASHQSDTPVSQQTTHNEEGS